MTPVPVITTVMARMLVCIAAVLLLPIIAPLTARADSEAPDDAAEAEEEQTPHTRYGHNFHSGYRFVSPDGPAAAAVPYGRLRSGMAGGLSAGFLGRDLKLAVDGEFLHGDDYHAQFDADVAGLLRFRAERTTLWHNLLTERIDSGTLNLLKQDGGAEQGLHVSMTETGSRVRLGQYPIHLNLGYWELRRQGYQQHIFSDHYFGTATSSIVSDLTRIDGITREGSAGIDAHLGWFDLSYGFRIRDFSNQAPDPRFTFTNNAGNALIPATQSHDVVSDNRVISHTVKAYSDLSGGLVGSAAYVLTQRENRGGHGEALPSSRPADTLHHAAGDISYTPSKLLSLALKYRHQQVERDTPATVSYPFAASNPLAVRPAIDLVRDSLTFSTVLRPAPKVIYRLEYRAELESRDNVRDWQSPVNATSAVHSDSRQTHTGTAFFYWRPYNGIKLNASYSYAACDNPAYAASFSERHTGQVLLTYLHGSAWGLTGSFYSQAESGEKSAQLVVPSTLTVTPANTATAVSQPRESLSESATVSFWFSPRERLTVTTSYSFLQTGTDQSLLLTALSQNALVATNYRSTAHVYGIDAVYAATERLDLSLAFQQVRSRSSFDVPAGGAFTTTSTTAPFTVTSYSSAGISGLTRLDTTETGVSAHAEWRMTEVFGGGLDYSFRLYDSGNAAYDGALHSTMLTLKARW